MSYHLNVRKAKKLNAKFIFVSGGVISSVGKGITASSIAMLLESRGYRVAPVKMDAYLNVDAGTIKKAALERGMQLQEEPAAGKAFSLSQTASASFSGLPALAKQRAAASNIMRRWATFLVEWSDGHYEQCRGESADTVAQRMARERYGIRATANRTTGVVFGSGMFQAKRGNMKKAGDPFAVTLVSPAEAHTQLDNK